MKRFFKSMMLLAAAATAFTACNKEVDTQEPGKTGEMKTIRFSAPVNEFNTKATLTTDDEANFTAAWETDDEMVIEALSEAADYAEEGTATWKGSFFELDLPAVDGDEDAGDWFYYGYYPARENIPFGSARVQNGNAYNSDYDIMKGEISYESALLGQDAAGGHVVIPMERLTSMIYFHLTSDLDEALASATLSVEGGDIAAESVSYNNGLEVGSGESNSITITFEGTSAPSAQDFRLWFNTLPVNATSLTLTVTSASGKTATLSNSNGANYEAGKLYKIVKSGLNWQSVTKGEEWSYTFTQMVFNANDQTKELNGKNWTLVGDGNYWGSEDRGQQFGSGSAPYKEMTLSTGSFGDFYGVDQIIVNTSGGSGIVATVSVKVGSTSFTCGGSTTQSLTTTATDYKFVSPDGNLVVGDIQISFTQTSSKAIYVKKIVVNPDNRIDPQFEYATNAYVVQAGTTLNTPVLSYVDGFDGAGSITYAIGEDDDPSVASVDASTGAVSIGSNTGTVTVTASFPGNESYKAASASYTITVTGAYDLLNNAWTGISGQNYVTKTGLIGSCSGAEYSVNAAGQYSSIQLRSSSNSGIVSTTSGGALKKITVKWNSNTVAGRVLDIYGSHTAYSSPNDLYGNSAGEKVTSFNKDDGDGSYAFTTNYEYIGICSNSGALYLDEIDIEWGQITWNLTGISVTTNPTKTEYLAGDSFDPTGMIVTASYVDANSSSTTSKVVTGYTYSPNGELTTDNDKVTISYTENGITKTADVDILVLPVPDWTLTGIAITKEPTIKSYAVGSTFDPTGMEVTASYVDQVIETRTKTEVIALDDPDLTFSPTLETPLTLTDDKVTVSYHDFTADQTITVTSTQDHTATILFGNGNDNTVSVNQAEVTAKDDLNNTWTITTTGTTSFTPNAVYSQIGSSNKPASSITFTTTLANSAVVKSMSAKFGGFSGTAGTVSLKVGDTAIGTGSLNGTNDVTVSSSSTAEGTVLSVTVTNISKGVKAYYITVTYNN